MDADKIWNTCELATLRDAWYRCYAKCSVAVQAQQNAQAPEHSIEKRTLSLLAGPWPTLDDLSAEGVDIHHSGFALICALESDRGRDGRIAFRTLDTGDAHFANTGIQMHGRLASDMAHPARLAQLETAYLSTFELAKPHAWRCINTGIDTSPGIYSRVVVPISDDVGDGRCLFGIWVWDAHPSQLQNKTDTKGMTALR